MRSLIIFIVCVGCSGFAQSSFEEPKYRLETVSLVSCSDSTRSENYTAVASVDVMGPLTTSSDDQVWLRSGYVFTLPLVKRVVLLAEPEMPEETLHSLPARARYDDETSAVLFGWELESAVISGDSIAMDALGQASTRAVYQKGSLPQGYVYRLPTEAE